MPTQIKITLLLTAVLLTTATTADAQWTSDNQLSQDLQRLHQQFNGNTNQHRAIAPQESSQTLPYRQPNHRSMNGTGRPQGNFTRHPESTPWGHQHPGYGNPNTRPHQPNPSYPVHVSKDRFDGYNPHTGGIDTRNEQVNNTYYDQHREASKHNGTRRWVRRPVYDTNGNISGYQEGYVWNNSVTGVEHSELQSATVNDKGGTHRQISVSSAQ